MASIWEKDNSILAGNLNSGRGYLITAVLCSYIVQLDFNLAEFLSQPVAQVDYY